MLGPIPNHTDSTEQVSVNLTVKDRFGPVVARRSRTFPETHRGQDEEVCFNGNVPTEDFLQDKS